MTEGGIPLADLQDLGQRYAPSVLRNFFISHGYTGSTGESSLLPIVLPPTESLSAGVLRDVRRILLWGHIGSIVLCVPGMLLFWFDERIWKDIQDLPLQANVVAKAIPGGVALALLFFTFLIACVAERLAWQKLPPAPLCVRELVAGIGSVLGRFGLILDLLSLIIVSKTVGGFDLFALFLVLLVLLGQQTSFGFIESRIATRHTSLTEQTELFLTWSIRSFTLCFGLHLLLLPVKMFFLLDFGFNPAILWSVWVRIFESFLSCLTAVVPLHKRHVQEYQES